MRILGLIPARGGSKGVPRKNIKLLDGKPLLQYTTEVALKSTLLDEVIVSSDDEEIIAVAKTLGVNVPFKRPKNLAEDNSPTLPVIHHALKFFSDKGKHFDAVCLLQTTSPIRTSEFLNQAIQTFIAKETDALVSVKKVPHEYNPHWVFEENAKGELIVATGDINIIPRRQNLPKAYHRDGSIYLTKTEVILNQNSLYGNSLSYIQSPLASFVNIDTLEDWEKAEQLIRENKF